MRKSLLFATLIPAAPAAQAADAASADNSLDTVVVTATRIPTPQSQIASSPL